LKGSSLKIAEQLLVFSEKLSVCTIIHHPTLSRAGKREVALSATEGQMDIFLTKDSAQVTSAFLCEFIIETLS
jgi:hypothetical protein